MTLPTETDEQEAVAIVQRQLDAYNARDLDALLATYAEDAEHHALHGPMLARGHAALRTRFAARLAEPDLHALLLRRTVVGGVVADHELVTRNFPEGRGTLELLCLYEVANGLIRRATFVSGPTRLAGRGAGDGAA